MFFLYTFAFCRRMTSLERSNVSVVTTMRRLQRSFDAIATKEGVSYGYYRRGARCVVEGRPNHVYPV